MQEKQKNICIAIPTYKREKELIRLLKSIFSQNKLPESCNFEILVINNNPKSYWGRVNDAFINPPFAMQCIDVEARGFSNVRNAAVSWFLDRNMDALIFVDDDEIVPDGWLNAMISAWEKYKGDIITGPVLRILPTPVSRWVKVIYMFDGNKVPASGEKNAWASSNNTLVSKRVLEVMGPSFHSALNHSGGEDTLFFHQCYLRGFNIFWDNSVMIAEPTTPERATIAYVLRRRFNNGATRITINQILFPEQWRLKSFIMLRKLSIYVLKSFAVSIIRGNQRRFGQMLCRTAWVAGLGIRLVGNSKITNKNLT